MVIFQGKGLYHGWFDADDDYADETAIFAHGGKGFTTNELATQWLSYLILGYGMRRMTSSAYLSWIATELTIVLALSAMLFKINTTHFLQPLDVGLFTPLQKAYGTAVHTHTRET